MKTVEQLRLEYSATCCVMYDMNAGITGRGLTERQKEDAIAQSYEIKSKIRKQLVELGHIPDVDAQLPDFEFSAEVKASYPAIFGKN